MGASSAAATPFAAAALLIAVAFACCTGERWRRRRRPHDAAWTAAMVCFAGGAAPLVAATQSGWTPTLFRLFYLLGGIVTVPVLALGTIYLLAPKRVADRVAVAVAMLGAFSAGVVLTAPLRGPLQPDRLNEGREVFGVLPRALAASASGVAALVVIIGALISAVSLLRRPGTGRQADGTAGAAPGADRDGDGQFGARRLAAANGLVAVGTVLISVKGPFVALSGSDEVGFAAALASGLAVIFAGFLIATAPTPATTSARTRTRPGAASARPA
ncbi:MAG: hypothetical protein ACKV2O_10295 [Acidimicrobiales bacterium]